jgi:hypothetical protein
MAHFGTASATSDERDFAREKARMQTRERIHDLVDELAEETLPAVERFLERMRDGGDPVLLALATAPEDDEPLTPEDEAAIEEGLADIAAGRVVSHEEVRRRLFGES